jgi:hypothetical protein
MVGMRGTTSASAVIPPVIVCAIIAFASRCRAAVAEEPGCCSTSAGAKRVPRLPVASAAGPGRMLEPFE